MYQAKILINNIMYEQYKNINIKLQDKQTSYVYA